VDVTKETSLGPCFGYNKGNKGILRANLRVYMSPPYKRMTRRKKQESALTVLSYQVGRAVPSSASVCPEASVRPLSFLRSPPPRAVPSMVERSPVPMLSPFRWATSIPPWSTLGLRPGEEVGYGMRNGIRGRFGY